MKKSAPSSLLPVPKPTPAAASVALAALALLVARPAAAHEGVSVQFKFGMSSFDLTAGQGYSQSGGLGGELRTQINYDMISIKSSLGLFSEGHLGSNIGSFPLSRVGAAAYFFPFGHPLATMPLDNGVTISQTRISLYVMGAAALSALAITDTSGAHPLAFNGSALAFQVGGGIEMPMTQTWSILGEFVYEGTLAGGSSDPNGNASTNGLSYKSIGGLFGFSIHP